MDACEEVSGSFFVARCDASKLLDVIEETLDQIAFSVEREVAFALNFAIGLGRDHDGDAAPFQALDETVGVIAFVGKQRAWL
jgi:hypothetical protein